MNYCSIRISVCYCLLQIGNHDHLRTADTYGPELVDAMNMLTAVLPGVKCVYYGEEIGMQDGYISWNHTVDPRGQLVGPDHYREQSRDPERTPMQWDVSTSAGGCIDTYSNITFVVTVLLRIFTLKSVIFIPEKKCLGRILTLIWNKTELLGKC